MIGLDNAYAHLGGGPGYLKRNILFFDRIVLLSGGAAIREWREGRYSYKSKYRAWADELEYLFDTELFEDRSGYLPSLPKGVGSAVEREDYRHAVGQMRAVWGRITNAESDPEQAALLPEERSNRFLYLSRLLSSLNIRIEALARQAVGHRAVALEAVPALNGGVASALTIGDLLEIVIDQVPMPDELTPWQDIMDLKKEDEFNSRLRKLRQWSTDFTRNGATREEASEAVAELLFEYRRFMEATGLKTGSGLLKSVVVGSAELLENLAKLRFGKIAKGLFTVSEARADLLLAEVNAPGRALSIVPMLQQRLAPKA